MILRYWQHVLGHSAEEKACRHLTKHGLKLVERNFRCKLGEIDLIMRDTQHLVFVEVRARNNTQYGNSAESVTTQKQKKLIKAALFYLQTKQLIETTACRFDIVAFDLQSQQLDWIQDAFGVEGYY